MFSILASHPFDPLEGANVYHYETSGLFLAAASACMVSYAIYYALKKRNAKSEQD